MYEALVAVFSILMLLGILGVFLPVVPGVPFMFVLAICFALLDRLQHISGAELAILGVIAVISFIIDHASGALGAKFGGASRQAILTGLIGTVIGTLLMPPFGGIVGLYVGVFMVEVMHTGDRAQAHKAAKASLIGNLTGVALNAILATAFLVLFIVFALR